jgi:E3 ubiquitin-protein ligase UBR1
MDSRNSARYSTIQRKLSIALGGFAADWGNRFTKEAHRQLLELLFKSLCGFDDQHLSLFFPDGDPRQHDWTLSLGQGAVEGAEYLESARGKACGHIFRNNEATYKCKYALVKDY